jgi:hypothetical protein
VPKFLPDGSGAPGASNDLRCVSLEHKLGIHGSPTAVLAFGDTGGAIGWLVGEENRGLEYMFSMMNMARLSVGLEGLGIAERAYQRALTYARDRVQGRVAGERAAIIRHPDVRRMLMDMRSRIAAMRGVAYRCAAALDLAHHHPDAAERARRQALADLLTPVVKGWSTEWGVRIASTGLQVHGGMGYVEETGAAQHYRDARITTIYEGTTGIQAMDLVGRKVLRDKGLAIRALIGDMRLLDEALAARSEPAFVAMRRSLAQGIQALDSAVAWLLDAAIQDATLPLAAAGPVLELVGTVVGGHAVIAAALRAHAALAAGQGDWAFLLGQVDVARFYAANILPQAEALASSVTEGSAVVRELADASF